MVTVTGLGGFREVGRSAILVEGKQRFLMDYGLSVQEMDIPLPAPLPLDGVFLSHAHLDHCGIIPELYKRGYKGRVFATPATHELASLMLADALKVQKKRSLPSFYAPHDLEAYERSAKALHFGQKLTIGHAEAAFFDAGHVPGSSAILLQAEGKRILYTGDIKFSATELMPAAFDQYKNIDLLISESTYSTKDHPDRTELRKELVNHVIDVVNANGIALFPVFSIGRTQEILQVLADLDVPLTLDGMGRDATQIALKHKACRNPAKLLKAFSKAHKVRSASDRAKALREPGAIVTTAGMLNGGPIAHYLEKLHDKENCSLYISGFQAPGTVGRILKDTGRYVSEEVNVKPKLQILFRDWSAHAGRSEILEFIRKVKPKKTLFVHGDRCEEFAFELTRMGHQALAPAIGEAVEV
ncbi:MAG: MBL fold metallo-hydrolase [Candidatus Aenigmarchaeota archaeon]|nr:MBL fold metallo-hydrolase [Candidatus Aenigmarchaeota archaeon]